MRGATSDHSRFDAGLDDAAVTAFDGHPALDVVAQFRSR
jgi:hypothetical protein